ncbi:MAG: Hpt domain-containing protein [Bacteroidetes bacterium]|nr:Hpt domain-containing protein [Bacteroidota bacterium]
MEFSKEEMLEIMAVFKGESAEHLKTLNDSMVEIQKTPSNPAVIEVLHRTSHSMKGAARMLSLTPIEQIGKALEDGFKAAKDGKVVLDAGLISVIREAIEGLHLLIEKLASEGTTEGMDITGLLTKLENFK